MKIYIMTDIEGVAGVLNSRDWSRMDGKYYDLAKQLLTRQVNAAIAGFAAAGADAFLVADGHGPGGIDPVSLDERAELLRGLNNGYPYELDKTFDAVAWVGQHAMARTPFAHMPHTGSYAKLEYRVNGVAVGEFGQLALVAGELGVRSIFGTGDLAFCKEAAALVPGIETVPVKRGLTPGRGDECTAEQYWERNWSAIHLHPERACRAIRAGAEKALRRAQSESFGLVKLEPPFEMVKEFRASAARPAATLRGKHPTSIIALFNSLPVDPPPA